MKRAWWVLGLLLSSCGGDWRSAQVSLEGAGYGQIILERATGGSGRCDSSSAIHFRALSPAKEYVYGLICCNGFTTYCEGPIVEIKTIDDHEDLKDFEGRK